MEESTEKTEQKRDKNKLFAAAGIAVLVIAGMYLIISSSIPKYTENTAEVNVTPAPQNSNDSLTSQKWTWVKTQMSNDTEVLPSTPGAFRLTFNTDLSLLAATDCNNGSGSYVVAEDNSMVISPFATTRKFCEGSNESQFYLDLENVSSYSINNGQLWLMLEADSGTMIFE